MQRSRRACLLLIFTSLGLGGCDPLFDIGGAFFPGWLLAAILGFVVTLLVRWILVRVRVDEFLWLRTVSYICLFTMCSVFLWLLFFRT
jgi:hypothetical protein